MFKRDCDIFTFFSLLYALLFRIIKRGGGVYSNDHLNISHPVHRGGGGGLTSVGPKFYEFDIKMIRETKATNICSYICHLSLGLA